MPSPTLPPSTSSSCSSPSAATLPSSPAAPVAEYAVQYAENSTPWGVVSAVFRWCETAEELVYDRIQADAPASSPPATRALYAQWRTMWTKSVRRRVTLRLHTDYLGERVRVSVRLTDVGRTSWGMEYTFRSAPAAAAAASLPKEEGEGVSEGGGRLLAVVHIRNVAVDLETMTKATPIPGRDAFARYADPPSPSAVQDEGRLPRRGGGAASRSTASVRRSDCDFNGHVNNSVHPVLALDALPLPRVPFVGCMEVEYLAQIFPQTEVRVDCWTCEEAGSSRAAYDCEYRCRGSVVARAYLEPLPEGDVWRGAKRAHVESKL
eukprot:Rhum_TRINITY_DN13256_c0_g2::Rhum_TRINITY_DN13256_c0_g2_i1::g.57967::m.57967